MFGAGDAIVADAHRPRISRRRCSVSLHPTLAVHGMRRLAYRPVEFVSFPVREPATPSLEGTPTISKRATKVHDQLDLWVLGYA